MNGPLRIVAADDDPFYHDLYRKLIPQVGHQLVGMADSGRALVEQCALVQPDLVISDIKMEDMDGINAAREICNTRPVPFILVSGYYDPELIERAQADYVLGYLIKPIRKADLETAIAIAMRRFEEFAILRMEADHYRQTLTNRKIIERAKGILMKRAGISETDAFGRLQTLAHEKNQKLVDIAQMILTTEQVMS
ncbi:MAG TPA: ANTAR domain-containing protein [Pirellulales bacterium]|jgi:response regulator NasT|nr:ANTAR domain-containing protein [Pirellulales bacterium]